MVFRTLCLVLVACTSPTTVAVDPLEFPDPEPPPEPIHTVDPSWQTVNTSVNGTRLLAPLLIPAGGGYASSRSYYPEFFDRELGIWCAWNTDENGVTRCLPNRGSVYTHYRDAACTEPVYLNYWNWNSRYVFENSTTAYGCLEATRARVYEITGWSLEQLTPYEKRGADCVERDRPFLYATDMVEVDPALFLVGTVTDVPLSPDLAARQIYGQDGSRAFLGYRILQGAADVSPIAATWTRYSADSACTIEVFAASASSVEETCPSVVAYDGGEYYDFIPLAATSAIYENGVNGCTALPLVGGASARLGTRGAEPLTLPPLPAEVAEHGAALTAVTTTFDSAKGFVEWRLPGGNACFPTELADGSTRCISGGAVRGFSDSGCTRPALGHTEFFVSDHAFVDAEKALYQTAGALRGAMYQRSQTGCSYSFYGDIIDDPQLYDATLLPEFVPL